MMCLSLVFLFGAIVPCVKVNALVLRVSLVFLCCVFSLVFVNVLGFGTVI